MRQVYLTIAADAKSFSAHILLFGKNNDNKVNLVSWVIWTWSHHSVVKENEDLTLRLFLGGKMLSMGVHWWLLWEGEGDKHRDEYGKRRGRGRGEWRGKKLVWEGFSRAWFIYRGSKCIFRLQELVVCVSVCGGNATVASLHSCWAGWSSAV